MSPSTKVRVLDGIWIYAKTATTVPLAFETSPQAVPPVKDLAAGWNAIGHAGMKPVTARDALSSVAAKWSLLQGFDAATQRYQDPVFTGGTGDYWTPARCWPGRATWLDMREPGLLAGRERDRDARFPLLGPARPWPCRSSRSAPLPPGPQRLYGESPGDRLGGSRSAAA